MDMNEQCALSLCRQYAEKWIANEKLAEDDILMQELASLPAKWQDRCYYYTSGYFDCYDKYEKSYVELIQKKAEIQYYSEKCKRMIVCGTLLCLFILGLSCFV